MRENERDKIVDHKPNYHKNLSCSRERHDKSNTTLRPKGELSRFCEKGYGTLIALSNLRGQGQVFCFKEFKGGLRLCGNDPKGEHHGSKHFMHTEYQSEERTADKEVPVGLSEDQALHDELVSLMHQESIAKVHNDAQRNAFEEETRRITLEKG
ncbi:hypothetical protein Tco_1304491 [Tanacetum coccineum]